MSARPLLIVTWRDHYAVGGWQDEAELAKQEPTINRSVGWLVAEDANRLTLVQTVGPDGVRDVITIEKSCVEKRRTLR